MVKGPLGPLPKEPATILYPHHPTSVKILSPSVPTYHRFPLHSSSVSQDSQMATLQFRTSPSFNLIKPATRQSRLPALELRKPWSSTTSNCPSWCIVRAYKVSIEHEGKITELEVEPDETILSRALECGLSVPHDCKLGVCMTCPALLVSGEVDQSEGMLSDDVVERGYALLCASYPRSDCQIRTIPEEELLSLQLATAND